MVPLQTIVHAAPAGTNAVEVPVVNVELVEFITTMTWPVATAVGKVTPVVALFVTFT